MTSDDNNITESECSTEYSILSGVFHSEFEFDSDDLTYNGRFLRFFNDGVVISVSIGLEERDLMYNWSTYISKWFHHEYTDRGKYYLSDSKIIFSVISNYGTVDYEGRYLDDRLILNVLSHINGNQTKDLMYMRLTNE